MPVIFSWKGYRFFFFSNEGGPREPIHVHVRKGEAVAKFWVEPDVVLAKSYGFNASELKSFRDVIGENTNKIRNAWYEFFKE